jgi:hypothetical protein
MNLERPGTNHTTTNLSVIELQSSHEENF